MLLMGLLGRGADGSRGRWGWWPVGRGLVGWWAVGCSAGGLVGGGLLAAGPADWRG
jgi:hypothetical protein